MQQPIPGTSVSRCHEGSAQEAEDARATLPKRELAATKRTVRSRVVAEPRSVVGAKEHEAALPQVGVLRLAHDHANRIVHGSDHRVVVAVVVLNVVDVDFVVL